MKCRLCVFPTRIRRFVLHFNCAYFNYTTRCRDNATLLPPFVSPSSLSLLSLYTSVANGASHFEFFKPKIQLRAASNGIEAYDEKPLSCINQKMQVATLHSPPPSSLSCLASESFALRQFETRLRALSAP